MLSFIIPAHNEERWIAACIGSIRAAMVNIAEPYEVIVVDDASTDATHQIAEQCGNVERGCPVVRGSPDPAPPLTEGLQELLETYGRLCAGSGAPRTTQLSLLRRRHRLELALLELGAPVFDISRPLRERRRRVGHVPLARDLP